MKFETLIIKLIEKYNEPLFLTDETGERRDNPRVINLKTYLVDNFVEDTDRFNNLFDKITKLFQPTLSLTFPTTSDLKEIQNIKDEFSETEKTDVPVCPVSQEKITFEYNLPEGIEFDLKTAILDNQKLNPDQMFVKYGIKKTGIIWRIEGAVADTHDKWFNVGLKKRVMENFKLSDYITEAENEISAEVEKDRIWDEVKKEVEELIIK